MKRFRTALLPLLLLIFGLVISGVAPAAGLDEDDVEFMQKAAIGGMFEIEAAQLVKSSGSDAEVKSFADMMIRDHTRMGAELKTLAQRKNVSLPTVLDDDHREKLQELSEKSQGEDFDDAYAEMMVEAHDDTVEMFEDTADDAVDPDLKALAGKSLPTLKLHKKQAETLEERLD